MIHFLAQIPESIVSTLIQSGSLGVVVLWFMLRHEKKVDTMTSTIGYLVQMLAVEVLTRPNLPPLIEKEVSEIKEAVDKYRKIRE